MSKSRLLITNENKEVAIRVDGVSKIFKIPHEKNYSLKGTVLNILKKKSYTKLSALNDISFEVKKGEFFGIVGRNGSGKSTLLKILAKIYTTDTGRVVVNGGLSPFLEVGVGFNPELTARENIYLNGALLGLSRKMVDSKMSEIVSFSELREFMDMKLKNFSSGMQVRLAFSIAIQAHSEIILVDEVLAVGDYNFQQKCFNVFRKLKKEGRTIIFVTHDMGNVEIFCDRAMLLEKGKIKYIGDSKKAAKEYLILNKE